MIYSFTRRPKINEPIRELRKGKWILKGRVISVEKVGDRFEAVVE